VASEKNGTWGNATAVPGTTASGRNAAGSVSCASAGNCVAGGSYALSIESPYQAFLVREKNGSWGTAFGVPGLAALNVDGNASVASVSCKTARNVQLAGPTGTAPVTNRRSWSARTTGRGARRSRYVDQRR
jgi:hypothetical protein